MKTFYILISIILLLECTNKMIKYTYADGSGNSYYIDSKNMSLEYNPVKPKYSSSGIYNGGEYKLKTITREELKIISDSINNSIQNESVLIENRVKLSGLIKIIKNNKEENFILKPGSQEQINIETVLTEIIKD